MITAEPMFRKQFLSNCQLISCMTSTLLEDEQSSDKSLQLGLVELVLRSAKLYVYSQSHLGDRNCYQLKLNWTWEGK